MFHRQETKAGFWLVRKTARDSFVFIENTCFFLLRCDICKQCFRKRKAILCVRKFNSNNYLAFFNFKAF